MFISRIGAMDDSAAAVSILDPLLTVVLSVGVCGLIICVAMITAVVSFVRYLKKHRFSAAAVHIASVYRSVDFAEYESLS